MQALDPLPERLGRRSARFDGRLQTHPDLGLVRHFVEQALFAVELTIEPDLGSLGGSSSPFGAGGIEPFSHEGMQRRMQDCL